MGVGKYVYYLFISKQPLIMNLSTLTTCTDRIFSNLGSSGTATEKGVGSFFYNQPHQNYSKGVFLFEAGDLVKRLRPLRGHD